MKTKTTTTTTSVTLKISNASELIHRLNECAQSFGDCASFRELANQIEAQIATTNESAHARMLKRTAARRKPRPGWGNIPNF